MHRRPPIQTSIESGTWEKIECPTLTGSTLEMSIPASSEHYLDLSQIQLYIQFGIYDNKNEFLKESVELSTANNILHSLFTNIKVNFNSKTVSSNNDFYNYKAYIENLLGFNKEAKETLLRGDGWFKDSVAFDSLVLNNVGAVSTIDKPDYVPSKLVNPGFKLRNKICSGKLIELCGNLHLDISTIDKLIMENNKVSLILSKAPEKKFFLGKESIATNYRVDFKNVFILVRRVKISPSIMLANNASLSKMPAQYPIKRVVVCDSNVGLKSTSHTFSDISNGSSVLPTRVVVGFVETTAQTGQFEKNPFNFQNFGIKSAELKVNLANIPYNHKIDIDFKNQHYFQAYTSLFKNIKEAPHDISYEEYSNGNFLLAFNLSPDLCIQEHLSINKSGQLDLKIEFDKALDINIKAIFYLEYDNLITISKSAEVNLDYTA